MGAQGQADLPLIQLRGLTAPSPEEATRVTWPVSQLGKWRRELETRAGLRSGLCFSLPEKACTSPSRPLGLRFPNYIMGASSLPAEPLSYQ